MGLNWDGSKAQLTWFFHPASSGNKGGRTGRGGKGKQECSDQQRDGTKMGEGQR